MSGGFLILLKDSIINYSSMSPWFFFRSLNSKFHPWPGLDTISPFPDTRHGTAMTSSLCKLSKKSVMSSLIPSMVQGLTLLIPWEQICHSQKSFGDKSWEWAGQGLSVLLEMTWSPKLVWSKSLTSWVVWHLALSCCNQYNLLELTDWTFGHRKVSSMSRLMCWLTLWRACWMRA